MWLIRKLSHYLLQAYGYAVFGRKVHVHGRFRVGNARNVAIGDGCSINYGVYILGHCKVVIEDGVVLSARAMVIDSGLDIDKHSGEAHIDSQVVLRRGCWIGAGATILPGVTVGEFSVVGAGSIVSRDVPAYAVVAGNPARVLRYRSAGSRGDH